MEYENKYASKGVAGTGLGLMAGGNGLGGLFNNNSCWSEDHYVNRYEARQVAWIRQMLAM